MQYCSVTQQTLVYGLVLALLPRIREAPIRKAAG
jgi:hypothetical protein